MPENLFDLSGRVALVTGGSKGLGKCMARAFAEQGAGVFICSRNADELRAAADEIRQGLTSSLCRFDKAGVSNLMHIGFDDGLIRGINDSENEMPMSDEGTDSRRRFLRSAGTGLLVLKSETVFGTQANSVVEFGLIGCGGRGTWLGGLFQEYAGARLVAMADVFDDQLDSAAQRLKAPSARRYRGLNGYKELVGSQLDVVLIESPPCFRPEQAAAAVAAGKHVYMAKPVAVDVAGCKSILATGKRAEGKNCFFTDFQFRSSAVFRELADRVRRGDIGTPVVGQVYYHTGRLGKKNRPGDSEAAARLRNWVFDQALSGDIIVEQNIHALDAACWFLNAHPVSAYGNGGRKVRVDVGDCWDHFVVDYEFPDVKVDFSSSQCIKGYNDICARIYGSNGTADAHYDGPAIITGPNAWKGTDKDNTGRQGTIDNVKTFVENVRAGRTVNNSADTVRSNLTAILGRTAAYRKSLVTWDQMMRSNESLDLKLGGIA